MAGHSVMARCSENFVPIYPEPWTGTLESTKTSFVYLGSTKNLWLTFGGHTDTQPEGIVMKTGQAKPTGT
jgi:hypothetical protein